MVVVLLRIISLAAFKNGAPDHINAIYLLKLIFNTHTYACALMCAHTRMYIYITIK